MQRPFGLAIGPGSPSQQARLSPDTPPGLPPSTPPRGPPRTPDNARGEGFALLPRPLPDPSEGCGSAPPRGAPSWAPPPDGQTGLVLFVQPNGDQAAKQTNGRTGQNWRPKIRTDRPLIGKQDTHPIRLNVILAPLSVRSPRVYRPHGPTRGYGSDRYNLILLVDWPFGFGHKSAPWMTFP